MRTSNRRDYSLDPFEPTVLDNIKESGLDVLAVGKIEDYFLMEKELQMLSTLKAIWMEWMKL